MSLPIPKVIKSKKNNCHLGYILSKEAVHQVVTNGYIKKKECNGENSTEVQFGMFP
jgi:hypothetical protein